MNDKDKEAFDEYISWLSDYYFGNDDRKTHDIKVWMAACAYKDIQIDILINHDIAGYKEGIAELELRIKQADKIIKDRQDELNYLVNKVEELEKEQVRHIELLKEELSKESK